MCLAIPGRVIEFVDADGHFATIEVSSVRRQVNVDLLRDDGLKPGDWVLIHVGFAMSKISPEDAAETLRILELLGEAAAAIEEIEGYGFGDKNTPRASTDEAAEPRGP